MLTSLKYMLFAVICTRNCEYHSWVYFLKFPKPQNAIHISTQENLTVLSISLHVLPQASKDNHAKCQTSNFMFSCTSSNLGPLESVLCKWEKCQVCEIYLLKPVLPSPICSLLQLLNLKVIENIFCLPMPFVVKSGLGCKGQILFEIQILQILP